MIALAALLLALGAGAAGAILVSASGPDRLGGAGSDLINATDPGRAEGDHVNCGAGSDRVLVDPGTEGVVAANCERVALAR